MTVAMHAMPELVADAHFAVEFDADNGIVRVAIQGCWTNAIVDAYAREFRACAAICRQRSGRLLVLTDARKMPIQANDVTARILEAEGYQPGDCVAVVLGKVLTKMATRRHLDSSRPAMHNATFDTIEDGERWLYTMR